MRPFGFGLGWGGEQGQGFVSSEWHHACEGHLILSERNCPSSPNSMNTRSRPTVYGTCAGRNCLKKAPSSRQNATKKTFHCSADWWCASSCHSVYAEWYVWAEHVCKKSSALQLGQILSQHARIAWSVPRCSFSSV